MDALDAVIASVGPVTAEVLVPIMLVWGAVVTASAMFRLVREFLHRMGAGD